MQVHSLVVEIGGNHVLPGRANAHTVRRFIIGSEAEALPHRGRLSIAHSLTVVLSVFAVSDLLHPIRETAHEFTVVVSVAGGEIELAVGGNSADRTGRHA